MERVFVDSSDGYSLDLHLFEVDDAKAVIQIVHGMEEHQEQSRFLQQLSVGSFNRQIPNPDTDVDWVAHNRETVCGYIADPLCGFGFTGSAYRDLYHLVIMMHDPGRYHDVNKEMPILMMRGEDDPCVGGDKGAADSRDVLERAGFRDIQQICYSGMRHEILNETEHRKVYADVLAFLLQ